MHILNYTVTCFCCLFPQVFPTIQNKPLSPFWGLLFTAMSYIQLHTKIPSQCPQLHFVK